MSGRWLFQSEKNMEIFLLDNRLLDIRNSRTKFQSILRSQEDNGFGQQQTMENCQWLINMFNDFLKFPNKILAIPLI